jgi:hypothetical protein
MLFMHFLLNQILNLKIIMLFAVHSKCFMYAKPIRSGGKTKQADFSDALIVNKAKRYEQLNKIFQLSLYLIKGHQRLMAQNSLELKTF